MVNTFPNTMHKEYSSRNSQSLEDFTLGSKKKVWWVCQVCDLEWETRIHHRTSGAGCPACGRKRSLKKRAANRKSICITHTDIACEWADSHDINLVSHGSNKKYDWKCRTCLNIFSMSPNLRCNRGSGCPYCYGRIATDRNSLSATRPDLACELVQDSLGPTLCRFSSKKVTWRCKQCKHIWDATVNNRSSGRGCPKCAVRNSKPQREIEGLLKAMGVSYKTEFKIEECRYLRPLPFDFAIFKDEDIKCLIEYQGEQHYFPIWGQRRLSETKRNDDIKRLFCLSKHIQYLEIPFWDRNRLSRILVDLV